MQGKSYTSLPLSARSTRSEAYGQIVPSPPTIPRSLTARQRKKLEPAPNHYHPKNNFSDGVVHCSPPRYSIRGPSRDKSDYLKLVITESASPGPVYFPLTSTSTTHTLGDSPRYSFNGGVNRLRVDRAVTAPAPGTYTPRLPRGVSINFTRSERPDLSCGPYTPGPGTYNPALSARGVGGELGDAPKYSMGVRINADSVEKPVSNPGPGTYQPSVRSVKHRPPMSKFGRAEQRYSLQSSLKRLHISNEHQFEKMGIDSPGPVYSLPQTVGGMSKVGKKGPVYSFGTASRFMD
eukprot:Rmarinus@m.21035